MYIVFSFNREIYIFDDAISQLTCQLCHHIPICVSELFIYVLLSFSIRKLRLTLL